MSLSFLLPVEIYENIFQYISSTSDQYQLQLVCRLWQHTARPYLYRSIHLDSQYHADRLIDCLKESDAGSLIQSLHLSAPSSIFQLAPLCPNLTRLEASNTHDIFWHQLCAVADHWPQLQRLPTPCTLFFVSYAFCVLRYPRLRQITLPSNHRSSELIREVVFDRLKEYKELETICVRHNVHVPEDGLDYPMLIATCPGLSHLKVHIDYVAEDDEGEDEEDEEEEEEEEDEEFYTSESEEEYESDYVSNDSREYCYACGSYHYIGSEQEEYEEDEDEEEEEEEEEEEDEDEEDEEEEEEEEEEFSVDERQSEMSQRFNDCEEPNMDDINLCDINLYDIQQDMDSDEHQTMLYKESAFLFTK